MAVAIVQRFGGALNLNVHLHALVLDGAFTRPRRRTQRCTAVVRGTPVVSLSKREALGKDEKRAFRLTPRRLGHSSRPHIPLVCQRPDVQPSAQRPPWHELSLGPDFAYQSRRRGA